MQRASVAQAKAFMDAYFERIRRLTANERLDSRLRFMLLDVVEQRGRGWEARRKKEGPKKIEVWRRALLGGREGGREDTGRVLCGLLAGRGQRSGGSERMLGSA